MSATKSATKKKKSSSGGGGGSSSGDSNVSVYCRIRPLLEQGKTTCVGVDPDAKTLRLQHSGEEHAFSFDRSFDTFATQGDLFTGVSCESYVRAVLSGYNATVFAYGQTASGKTHTMEGGSTEGSEAGIVPRAASALFEGVAAADCDIEFTIKVSFVEIYMEKIRDLLDTFGTKEQNLRIREDANTGIYVAGCTEAFVTNEAELLAKLREGAKARMTAATGMNEGSSRSHSVLSCLVTQRHMKSQAIKLGKLVLVDLAGSEMVRKTHATGQQLEEAKTINKSLSALGHVINALTDGSTHVPYRDSKLTRMLQDSLGGNAKTALIVNVSAATENAPETLSTLRFGQRAKAVHNKPKVNERKSVDELTALLAKAETAIDMQSSYISALEAQLQPGAVVVSNDVAELQRKVVELLEQLDEEKSESVRCAEEVKSLTELLRDKERLLSDADEVMKEAQEKLSSVSSEKEQATAHLEAVQAELSDESEAKNRLEFEKKELELQLENLSAVDSRLKEEAAKDAAVSKLAGGQGAASVDDNDIGFLTDVPVGGLDALLARLPLNTAQQAELLSHFKPAAPTPPPPPSMLYPNRSKQLVYEMQHQREKLVADVAAANEERGKYERMLDDATTGMGAVATARERQHMRSLQRRLEQLVAVHRQLLRKYAALELTLTEATKKIALRDERIGRLELSTKQQASRSAMHVQRLEHAISQLDASVLKRSSKDTAAPQHDSDVRTVRGGQQTAAGAPQTTNTPTRSSWLFRSRSST